MEVEEDDAIERGLDQLERVCTAQARDDVRVPEVHAQADRRG